MLNKTKILQYLDALDESANYARAVNIVVNDKGKFIGYNTDGKGIIKRLEDYGVEISGKKFVILGAGGAGTAIALQGALDGAGELAIFNRKDEFFMRNDTIPLPGECYWYCR